MSIGASQIEGAVDEMNYAPTHLSVTTKPVRTTNLDRVVVTVDNEGGSWRVGSSAPHKIPFHLFFPEWVWEQMSFKECLGVEDARFIWKGIVGWDEDCPPSLPLEIVGKELLA